MKPLVLWISGICLALTGLASPLTLATDSVYRTPDELKLMSGEDLGYFALDLRDIHLPAVKKTYEESVAQLKTFEDTKGCKNVAKSFSCAAAFDTWLKDPKAQVAFPSRSEREAYKAYKTQREKVKKNEDQIHKLELVLLETGVQLTIKTTPMVYVAKKPQVPGTSGASERQPASAASPSTELKK